LGEIHRHLCGDEHKEGLITQVRRPASRGRPDALKDHEILAPLLRSFGVGPTSARSLHHSGKR
jgi:hypothetical protein